MKLIAHRGNLNGPNLYENHPNYLLSTLAQGYECEVDVWVIQGKILLGHDAPTYVVDEDFIHNKKLWLHAKNIAALDFLIKKNLICFWHESDQYTLTSNGYIWANFDMPVTNRTIIVSLQREVSVLKETLPYAVCTDYVENWAKLL